MPSAYELAQLNIANLAAPLDTPRLSDFVDNLERINALAEQSPGFVWRLQTDDGDATSIRPFGASYIVNLSVWKDIDSLHAYVYRSAHAKLLSRRKEWFLPLRDQSSVLWWVPTGHLPTVAEAQQKLRLLQTSGASPQAFTFKKRFAAPLGSKA